MINPMPLNKMNFESKIDNTEEILSTGFENLDKLTGNGFPCPSLTIIASRPAMGKSSLSHSIALNLIKRKIPVLFFSLEFSREQVYKKLRIQKERKLESFVFVDDDININPEKLRTYLEIMKNKFSGQGIVFIDYLQLLKLKQSKTREESLMEFTRELKAIAKEFNVPVILNCQLGRNIELRADKYPTLNDFKENDFLTWYADLILFLYREDYYFPEAKNKGETELIIAKNNFGPTGIIKLCFDTKTCLYYEERTGKIDQIISLWKKIFYKLNKKSSQKISVIFLDKPAEILTRKAKSRLKNINLLSVTSFETFRRLRKKLEYCSFLFIVADLDNNEVFPLLNELEKVLKSDDIFGVYVPLGKLPENLSLQLPIFLNTKNENFIGQLKTGILCLQQILSENSLIRIDNTDIKNTLSGAKFAFFGTGTASGENRVTEATKKAINGLEQSSAFGNAIYHVSGQDLLLTEVYEGTEFFRENITYNEDGIILGAGIKNEGKGSSSVNLILSLE